LCGPNIQDYKLLLKIFNFDIDIVKSVIDPVAMRPIFLKCPSCDGNLVVSQLRCPSCTIEIDGEFAMPALLKLGRAQIDFVEVFLKNRGVIREVERELGVSYPTVRARLDEVVAALGYEVRSAAPAAGASLDAAAHRRAVLADLKAGKITPEDALAALSGGGKRSED
jgi:hypothetical protein